MMENKDEQKQEVTAQQALGNTDLSKNQSEPDSLSLPKTSGTGANPAAAAPDSLIVKEDKTGQERYQNGKDA